jgi:hypothetical protein
MAGILPPYGVAEVRDIRQITATDIARLERERPEWIAEIESQMRAPLVATLKRLIENDSQTDQKGMS